jgi:hypothetical protein
MVVGHRTAETGISIHEVMLQEITEEVTTTIKVTHLVTTIFRLRATQEGVLKSRRLHISRTEE